MPSFFLFKKEHIWIFKHPRPQGNRKDHHWLVKHEKQDFRVVSVLNV